MAVEIEEVLPLAAKIAREFSNIPGLPTAEIEMTAQEALAKKIATTIDQSLVRNPKDRFPNAGKLLAAIR